VDVHVILKFEMVMPYLVSSIVSIHKDLESAKKKAEELEAINEDKLEEDDYGPLRGSYYEVRSYELQI
jgi:hypothetical protein